MHINSVMSYKNTNPKCLKKEKSSEHDFSKVVKSMPEEASNAKNEREKVKQDGVFKGRFALINTGLNSGRLVSINYLAESTPDDPIMISSDGDKIHINDIDPSHASELEMQMYCAHLDATGKGTGNTFGTYNDLTLVRTTAHLNGFSTLGIMRDETMYREVKSNWLDLTKEVMNIVRGNDKKQYESLEKLFDGISKV